MVDMVSIEVTDHVSVRWHDCKGNPTHMKTFSLIQFQSLKDAIFKMEKGEDVRPHWQKV